jgi:hypothetical protein
MMTHVGLEWPDSVNNNPCKLLEGKTIRQFWIDGQYLLATFQDGTFACYCMSVTTDGYGGVNCVDWNEVDDIGFLPITSSQIMGIFTKKELEEGAMKRREQAALQDKERRRIEWERLNKEFGNGEK